MHVDKARDVLIVGSSKNLLYSKISHFTGMLISKIITGFFKGSECLINILTEITKCYKSRQVYQILSKIQIALSIDPLRISMISSWQLQLPIG